MMDLQWLNSIIDLLPSDEDYQNSFFGKNQFGKSDYRKIKEVV